MQIIQSLVAQNMYDIKCPYSMTPKGITVHNTANDASAKNEIAYMKSNRNEVSYHIAVDDIEAIQAVPFDRNTWHAGDGGSGFGNRQTIAIEICYSKSGGAKFDKAEKNCAVLVAQLLKQFGWGLDKVYTHQKHSGKYCPHRTLDYGWDRFMNMVREAYNGTVSTPTVSQPSSTTSIYRVRKSWSDSKSQIFASKTFEGAKAQCKVGYSVFDEKGNCLYTNAPIPTPTTNSEKRYAENGVFTFNTAVTVRTAPQENARTNVVYYAGEKVTYHHVILNKNGFNWIEYARSNGTTGYLKIKDLSNGESYGYAV